MNSDFAEMNLPETDKQRAARELAQAREKHLLAYVSAKDVPSDPEDALLRKDAPREATQNGRQAYRGYVRAALDPLAAQINGSVQTPLESKKRQNKKREN